MSTSIKQKSDLTEGKILPKIIMFALPLIATSVLQLLFNTADTVVVGRWGGATPEECEIALGAVGSCGALINLIASLFMGLSVGAGVCVAHDIGAKNYDGVEKTVHTSVLTALIASLFATAIGLIFAEEFLILMGIEKSLLPQATLYMRAFFCGMPANLLYNYCASMIRSSGDTTRPLIFLTSAGVINVILNLILVIGFSIPGSLGVGIATAASHWIACILVIIYMLRTNGPCRLRLKKLRIDTKKFQKIIAIGLPSGLQGSLFSISNVIIQSAIHSLGSATVVAGNTAAGNIEGYTYVIMNAFAVSAMTFTGQHVGAKKYGRLKKVFFWHVMPVVTVGIAIGGIIYIFGRPLIGLFSPGNDEIANYGMLRLGVINLTYFLCGFMEICSYTLRGFGKSLTPTVVSLVGSCLSRIVWIYAIFYPFFPNDLTVLFLSYPITWALTSSVLFIFLILEFKKHKSDTPLLSEQ